MISPNWEVKQAMVPCAVGDENQNNDKNKSQEDVN
jgi:hypothetical protein